MMGSRLAALLLTFVPVLLSASRPAEAVEVGAYRPDPTLQPARAAVVAPLRIAEALSIAPFSQLTSAKDGARAELEALATWNGEHRPRHPLQVGFARELERPLRMQVELGTWSGRVGERAGDGFVGRSSTGAFVWGTSAAVEDAAALRIELAEVDLPPGTRLWVYGLGGEPRAFDLRHLRSDRTLISPVIDGDRIYLEVELPQGRVGENQGFTVRRLHELVRPRAEVEPAATEADACLQNGECFDAVDFPGIETARDSAIQYIFTDGDTFVCSATLLNDVNPATVEPWILTANHCVPTQDVALTMDTAFHYRRIACGTTANSFAPGPYGADLVVASAQTDVALVRSLDGDLIPAGVVYAGWTSIRPADGIVLHRISHPLNEALTGVYTQMYSSHQVDDTPPIDCFDAGAPLADYLYTMNTNGTGISGGSSGSAIMQANGQVVGQLFGTCGTPPTRDGCGTDESIVDGAFSTSYPLLAPYIATLGELCFRDVDTACLLNGKFKVEVEWTTATDTGNGRVMAFNGERAESSESAFFWFFNPTNFEMGVKMVDACVAPFNRYWAFVSGLTSQQYRLRVTQMSTGEVETYFNPLNTLPTTEGDTDAFTCP